MRLEYLRRKLLMWELLPMMRKFLLLKTILTLIKPQLTLHLWRRCRWGPFLLKYLNPWLLKHNPRRFKPKLWRPNPIGRFYVGFINKFLLCLPDLRTSLKWILLTFFKSKVDADWQEFIDDVYKILYAMGVSTSDNSSWTHTNSRMLPKLGMCNGEIIDCFEEGRWIGRYSRRHFLTDFYRKRWEKLKW